VLLEAVALLAPDYPTLELLLPGGLGEAGVKEMLDTLIIEHHLQGRVHFYGMVENVYDYLRAADLFVMPSEREGLPNALLEALNCGLPAVATQIGGIMDVIQNHRGGILVPVGDVEALAAAIRQLMNDPETRRKQGETAAQIGVAYDFRGMTDRYIAAYDDMAKTPPRKVGQ
jgi:glycosyltransferase involved in cell wall biosynthesis